jgi:hypothetical protein
MFKRLMILLALGISIVAVIVQGQTGVSVTKSLYVHHDTAFDTAQAVDFTPTAVNSLAYACTLTVGLDDSTLGFVYTTKADRVAMVPGAGVDSFVYADTFLFGSGSTKIAVKWTSPSYKVQILPDSILDDRLYWLKFSFCDDSVKWTSPSSGTDLAMICDSITAYINAAPTISDSVKATDGTAYVTINSKHSETVLASTWTIDAPPTLLDTATLWQTTVAQACSAMTAAVEAATYVTDSVAAEDSTTRYIIKSIVAGLKGDFGIKVGDTTQDTVWRYNARAEEVTDSLVALINAAAKSADELIVDDSTTFFRVSSEYAGRPYTIDNVPDSTDTSLVMANVTGISDDSSLFVICPTWNDNVRGRSLTARMIISTPTSGDTLGVTSADSVRVFWHTIWWGRRFTFDSTGDWLPIPCTTWSKTLAEAGDTTMRNMLEASVIIKDTFTAEVRVLSYPINVDAAIKE